VKNNLEFERFIKERSELFWYTPENKKSDLSREVIVETILNYGDEKDVKRLFESWEQWKLPKFSGNRPVNRDQIIFRQQHIISNCISINMHKEILSESQILLLPLISAFRRNFYLAGGTAVALHIGHRRSIDFDLFCHKEFEAFRLKGIINKSGFTLERIIHESADQMHVIVNGVKLTFLQYPYLIVAADKFGTTMNIPDLITLAAMKALALGGRAKWKDYVDLYFLLKDHFSLGEIEKKAEQIFNQNFNGKLFRQQLAWYKDIDFSESLDYMFAPQRMREIREFLTSVANRAILVANLFMVETTWK